MLSNIINKIKGQVGDNKNDFFVALVIILVAVIGFGLGRLSVIYEQKKPIKIEYRDQAVSAANLNIQTDKGEPLVASVNSNKYHFEWCPGAKRIKEENKIRFASKKEAEIAGYIPAGNCEGL